MPVKGPVFHLQHFVGGVFDAVRDGVAVGGAEHQRAEHEHIERAGHHVAGGVWCFSSGHPQKPTPEEVLVEQYSSITVGRSLEQFRRLAEIF